MYTLERSIIVNTTMEEAWAFLSNPQNLNKITPDDLSFKILSEIPDKMYNGLLITYKIRIPFMGWQSWLTEIKHIHAPYSFVDEQRVGPYQLWYHYHKIEEVPNGVKLIDKVTYALPFGIFGWIAHGLFVRRMLENIFNYREEMFKQVFKGKINDQNTVLSV